MLGVVLGAALQLRQPRLWPLAWYVAGAALACALLVIVLRSRVRGALRTFALLLLATVLCAGTTGWRAASFLETRLDPALEGADLQVTGIVAAMPHRSEAGLRLRFEPGSAQHEGRAVALPPQVMVGWYVGGEGGGEGLAAADRLPGDVRPGERWQWTVRLKAPHGNVNPQGFDYELWLWEQGIQATGYVRAGPRDPPPRRLAATWAHPVERARHAVRAAIYAQVSDPRLAGVLAALVVGDQGAIERADWDVFRATGVAHLMSISGLHVTMFAWAAAALVGRLWRRSRRLCLAWPAQHAGLAGGILLAAGYALFSGWGVPAQRTVFMLAAVGLLRLAARAWPWPHVWLLACATVVAIDPWALTQAGFWLSFVAVGVLFASGPASAAPAQDERRGRVARLLRAIASLAREQWVVTLALAPLSLLLFGQVSLVGLLANLVAIPWVTLVVTPLGLAGVLAAPLWNLAAQALDLLGAVLRVLAQLPFATWSAPAPPLWAGAAAVLGGLLLAARAAPALRLLGVPLMLPVLLWQAPRPPAGEFELLAADVGQGNAVLVRTATHTLVYDAGPGYSRESDAGQRVLVPLLRAGGETVDLVVLSHRDSDHTGGATAVLRMQPGARLLSSLEEGHPLQAIRPSTRCSAGQHWDWDGVRFQVLHPAAEDYEGRGKPNALSCVLRIDAGHASALLAGDIEQPQETALLARGAPLAADVLLVPHHGSRTSSSDGFLDAVHPWAAVVQAGYRNRFGHPAPAVQHRYQERGIVLALSPRCGAARWDSRIARVLRCERREAPHYWHHDAARSDTGEQ
ncbi:DNA internalization-related competence protein ComEC/Rec2 [Ramlibacter alkalitolerans]|uniref:DNA internalization-related competence protein ComEC/Rec2 n=1 Tax=Ramlibacter alkalitolerans TaxID=2039631 RepID=A0ABS1JJU7_9BURK|nr:DNA internalization-related competence protein ComEC/Rec2 [Ramlibacter alkalitolerans]MBL0424508.1 DNA internalization-related competence protein ComEC/Rec2 [Ramlibacter alkalitolerans]